MMRDVVILFVHLIVTVIRLARPGGVRSVVAESVVVRNNFARSERREFTAWDSCLDGRVPIQTLA
jgi:hypothetical protein